MRLAYRVQCSYRILFFWFQWWRGWKSRQRRHACAIKVKRLLSSSYIPFSVFFIDMMGLFGLIFSQKDGIFPSITDQQNRWYSEAEITFVVLLRKPYRMSPCRLLISGWRVSFARRCIWKQCQRYRKTKPFFRCCTDAFFFFLVKSSFIFFFGMDWG